MRNDDDGGRRRMGDFLTNRTSVPLKGRLGLGGLRLGRAETAPALMALALSLASVLLVIYGTRQGALIGPDSATYIAGARNLAAGRGYLGFDLRPTTLFPPGFSTTLAVTRAFGIDPVTAARWLNASALGTLCMLTFILARRHCRFRWSPVIAAAAVSSMPAIFHVFTAVVSDPVFCVLAVAVVLILESIPARHGHDHRLVVAAGILASISTLFRYAGVTLIALGVAVICALLWGTGARKVLRKAALFLVSAAAAPAILVVWNSTRGSAVGPRPSSAETLTGLLGNFATALRGWVIGSTHTQAVAGNVLLIAGAALVVWGAVIMIRTRRREARSLAPLVPTALFVVIYVGYLVASEFQTALDPIGDRLLSPIVAPMVVLATISLESFVVAPRTLPKLVRLPVLTVVVSAWLVAAVAVSISHAHDNSAANSGYAATWWTRSDLVAAVRQLPAGATIFSNNPPGLYLATAIQPIYGSPTVAVYRSNDPPPPLAIFTSRLAAATGPTYLAWERIVGDTWDVTPRQLQAAGFHLTPVRQAHFGTIYRIGS